MTYQSSELWKSTLAERADDPFSAPRSKLRVAYETARNRVSPLVTQAHHDCFGLTIHDVTHLDALWEMASTILGDVSTISPLEAFIFGASILLHDTALSVAAYEGGLTAIKQTQVWKRSVISQMKMAGISSAAAENIADPPSEIARSALFSTLRSLHAEQAARLAEREWIDPVSKNSIFIIEDFELRSFYSQIIGRIAYSHHWDIEELPLQFPAISGTNPDFPAEWKISPLRIACLLRCSDAAHIDRRRAPAMDYALIEPAGLSETHWRFQNHLASPRLHEGRLIYSSGRDFGRNEADAWWLCFDTARMISHELEQSAALLEEHNLPRFSAKSVDGILRPKLFASHVRCAGWEPVDAEIRVSDPISLARTLGGGNLYGEGFQAPIRELLQNAIDAVKLRITVGSPDYKGLIRVTVGKSGGGRLHLKIEDNGIGMSERVLTTALIDFGKSLWNSDSIAQEYPGVTPSKAISGKFGIGFFSTFLLGDNVTVFSRRFDKGVSDVLALDFSGLSRRPILRKSSSSEFNDLFCTQVHIVLAESVANKSFIFKDIDYSEEESEPWRDDFFNYCKFLTASSPVSVEFVDLVGGRSFQHSEEWKSLPSIDFINILYDENDDEVDQYLAIKHEKLLTDLKDEEESVVGRAAISLAGDVGRVDGNLLSVGGLTYHSRDYGKIGSSSTSIVPAYYGIMPGDTSIATRSGGYPSLSTKMLSAWASEQARLARSTNLSFDEKMRVAHAVYWAGGNPDQLPIGLFRGRPVSIPNISDIISREQEVYMPVEIDEDGDLFWDTVDSVERRFFIEPSLLPVLILPGLPENRYRRRSKFHNVDNIQNFGVRCPISDIGITEISGGPAAIFMDLLKKMGRDYQFFAESADTFGTGLRDSDERNFIVISY